jgi:DNA-binding transcriptional regulator YdaS (Cro superfamily)
MKTQKALGRALGVSPLSINEIVLARRASTRCLLVKAASRNRHEL